MNTLPCISVVVPVYNVEKYLSKTLDSIINQTYQNLEIILVNDGSVDGSGKICDEYAYIDSRIKVIHKENGGVSRARNEGLRVSTGDYIGFVDSDDMISPDMYENLYQDLINSNADISVCNQTRVFGDERKLDREGVDSGCMSRDEAICNMLLGKKFQGGPCNKLFKASLIKDIEFDTDIFVGEDLLFVTKAMLESERVYFNSESFYDYIIREGSACKSYFSEKHYTDHISRTRILDCMLEDGSNELIEAAYSSMLLCNIALMEKLYYDKKARANYCRLVKKNIKKSFSFKRIKELGMLQKIGVLCARISYHLFFIMIPFKKLLRG